MTLSERAKFDLAANFWSDRSLTANELAELGTAPKWLYSVWDDPARCHDHAPNQSDGWPDVVCKEGSD